MTTIGRDFCTASLALAMIAGGAVAANAADLGAKDETIKLAMLEWTGQHVSTHIAGQLLQRLGYKVEYVTAGNFPEFTGLSDGTISASVEVWMNNVGDVFPKALADKKIEDIGKLNLETKEGWIYPKYMEAICPGLPDWTALTKPDCIKALAGPDTAPKGRFLDYPADWGSRAATIIGDNNMELAAVPAGSEGALVAELESAAAAKKPLVMMFWAPHFALAQTEVGWVKMPPCKTQEQAHCITPPDVDKIVWSGFGKKWPAALEFLRKLSVDATQQQQMMLRVDKKGEDLDAVAKEWVDKNEAVWKPWIAAAQG